MSGGGNESGASPGGEPIPLHQVETPEARLYADLVGTAHDLDRVRLFIDAWFQTEDLVLQDALFTAALIAYRRCFTTGVRAQLDPAELTALGNDAAEFHRYLCEQASKLAAHPVNAFEQVKIGVVVQKEQVAGIGPMLARMMSFQREGFVQWRSLVDYLVNRVLEPQLVQAAEAALQSARDLPLSQIVSAPTLGMMAPHHSQAGKRRR